MVVRRPKGEEAAAAGQQGGQEAESAAQPAAGGPESSSDEEVIVKNSPLSLGAARPISYLWGDGEEGQMKEEGRSLALQLLLAICLPDLRRCSIHRGGDVRGPSGWVHCGGGSCAQGLSLRGERGGQPMPAEP